MHTRNIFLLCIFFVLEPLQAATLDPIIGIGNHLRLGCCGTHEINVTYEDWLDGVTYNNSAEDSARLLFSIPENEAIVGQSYILDSGLAFEFIQLHMTDGDNDVISLSYGGGTGKFESTLFYGDASGIRYANPQPNIDFLGYSISSFELLINCINDCGGLDIGSGTENIMLNVSYIIRGTPSPVPTPSTLLLLSTGLLGLIGITKRKS